MRYFISGYAPEVQRVHETAEIGSELFDIWGLHASTFPGAVTSWCSIGHIYGIYLTLTDDEGYPL